MAPAGTCVLVTTYVVTAADVTAGSVVNVGTADAVQAGPVTEGESVIVPTPSLEVVKVLTANADEDGSGDVSVGDTLTYTLTATNTGTANLTNVVVSDDLTGDSTTCARVAPGASCVLKRTYVVTATDVAAGSVVNVGTADAVQVGPVTEGESVTVPTPSLEVVKVLTANDDADGSGDVSVGDTLTYTLTATNTGTANLTDVVVSDPLITPGSTSCALVAPGATCVLIGTYVVTAADVTAGSIVNTATADSVQTAAVADDETVSVPTPALAGTPPRS